LNIDYTTTTTTDAREPKRPIVARFSEMRAKSNNTRCDAHDKHTPFITWPALSGSNALKRMQCQDCQIRPGDLQSGRHSTTEPTKQTDENLCGSHPTKTFKSTQVWSEINQPKAAIGPSVFVLDAGHIARLHLGIHKVGSRSGRVPVIRNKLLRSAMPFRFSIRITVRPMTEIRFQDRSRETWKWIGGTCEVSNGRRIR
jgi:hypothetical protein